MLQRYNGSGNMQVNGNFVLYKDHLEEIQKMLRCTRCNTAVLRTQKYCMECGSQLIKPKTTEERLLGLELLVSHLEFHVKTGEPWREPSEPNFCQSQDTQSPES